MFMTELAPQSIPRHTRLSRLSSIRMQYARAFAGLFIRDPYVLRREIFPFVIRVCMNPLLFLFVFTYIMPHMSGGAAMNPTASAMGATPSTVLLPGLMAEVAIMFSLTHPAPAGLRFPLAHAGSFGITRESRRSRNVCPLPQYRPLLRD